MNHVWLDSLRHHLEAGHISRRDFVKRATALGFSLPVISAVLAACGGEDEEDAGEGAAEATQPETSGAAAETPTSGGITVDANVTEPAEVATPEAKEVEPTNTPAPTPAAAAAGGGSVVFARTSDSENMDPVTQDGNINIWVFMNIYDQLVNVAEDGVGLVPGLATDWEISEDGLTYTFNILEGVMFADGTPMTVQDIKWSLERAKNTEESPWTFTLEPVQEITTPDDSTVVITLAQPLAPFISNISMFNSSVISQEFAERIGVENLVDQTMGTGPFNLGVWNKAESMTLVPNEYYREEGLPLVDEVTLVVVPDSNSQILQLQGGEIDGIIGQGDVPFNRVQDLEQDPNLQVYRFTSTYNNFVVFNVRNEPLNDVKVRQALNYATDKQALIDTVLFGNAEFSNSFMPRGALYWNPDQEGYPYNLEMAQQLIAESNHPDGFPLTFDIRSGNQLQLQIATALQDMWSRINVNLEILQHEQGVFSDRYTGNQFEARLSGWTNDINDPDQLCTYAIIPETVENYHTGWVNERAVELALRGREVLDPDERREIYYEIQQIHMEDAPFIYLYVLPYLDVLNTRVKDYFHHPMGQYVFKRMYVEE